MRRKRIFPLTALLLLFALLASSCGGGKTPAEQTTAATSETTATTSASSSTTEATTTAASTVAPYTPPTDFGGYEFVLASETMSVNSQRWLVETPSNAIENQLLHEYERLETELNISFVGKLVTYNEAVANAVAGKSVGDVYYSNICRILPLATKEYILPLNTDEIRSAGLDVDDPEQVDYYATQLSKQIDGENVWSVAFSGRYFDNRWGYGLAFNKELLDKAGYPADTMYQLVRDGKWTWEKFEEICLAFGDTDWNGYYILSYIGNFGGRLFPDIATFTPIVSRGDDGKWRSNIDTPEFRSAAEFFDKILGPDRREYNEYCAVVAIERNGDEGLGTFRVGQAGMFIRSGKNFDYEEYNTILSAVDDYGFIPMPKASEEGQYVSVYEPYGFCIESTNPDPQRSAYILSELSKILNDPFYLAINIRGYMRDDESVEMITEYVRPNSVIPIMTEVRTVTNEIVQDLQYLYDGTISGTKSLDEIISTYHPQLQAALDELFEQ